MASLSVSLATMFPLPFVLLIPLSSTSLAQNDAPVHRGVQEGCIWFGLMQTWYLPSFLIFSLDPNYF